MASVGFKKSRVLDKTEFVRYSDRAMETVITRHKFSAKQTTKGEK
jgi:hypothetical protein